MDHLLLERLIDFVVVLEVRQNFLIFGRLLELIERTQLENVFRLAQTLNSNIIQNQPLLQQ